MSPLNLLGLALILGTTSCNALGGDPSPAALPQLKTRANEAREVCAAKIHFDTYSFEPCIDKLSQRYKKDDLSRLATEYAGFAVALSTTRVGMLGADDTAKHFYWRYRPLQEKLGISDLTLCESLPGNCKIRVAQTQELAKAPRPKKTAPSKPSAEHEH